MFVFEVLGKILGKILRGEDWLVENSIEIVDVETIGDMIESCDEESAGKMYRVIENGSGYDMLITFGRNSNGEAEIASVLLENVEGDSVCCDIMPHLIEILGMGATIALYRTMCDEIMS